jgi:A/G-specific adenine glycosylase
MKRLDVAIAIVCRGQDILICRRRAKDRLGGYWEFPGGKVEPEESLAQCLARELKEELDIQAEPIAALPTIDHDYPDIQVRLHPFLCRHTNGEPVPLGCEQALWINPSALRDYRFPPANARLIEQVIESLSRQG